MSKQTKNNTIDATMTATEKEAGKEARIKPLEQDAMDLNMKFVRKESPVQWKDVCAAADVKGSSLNISEFGKMIGLTPEAGKFLISEEAGLHRKFLTATALNNRANKLGHDLTEKEVKELVSLASLPKGTACAACAADGVSTLVEKELIAPKLDRETGFFRELESGALMLRGQSFKVVKVNETNANTRVTRIDVMCPAHVGVGSAANKTGALPHAVAAGIAERGDKLRKAGDAYMAQNQRPEGGGYRGGPRQDNRRNDEGDDGDNRGGKTPRNWR